MRVRPPPSNRIWFGFYAPGPDIDLLIQPLVSDTSINFSPIQQAIERRIVEAVREGLTLPQMDCIAMPGTDNYDPELELELEPANPFAVDHNGMLSSGRHGFGSSGLLGLLVSSPPEQRTQHLRAVSVSEQQFLQSTASSGSIGTSSSRQKARSHPKHVRSLSDNVRIHGMTEQQFPSTPTKLLRKAKGHRQKIGRGMDKKQPGPSRNNSTASIHVGNVIDSNAGAVRFGGSWDHILRGEEEDAREHEAILTAEDCEELFGMLDQTQEEEKGE